MDEDDIYRLSTQYRYWSFTQESLDRLRETTNLVAATRVRDAIKRLRSEGPDPQAPDEEIDCLTVEEEQKLVSFYCRQAMDFADFCNFPTVVKATAVQYLKRFYLSNSPMTYHPKQVAPAAQFLATKTENFYTRLEKFAENLPKTTPEAIIAPEFLLTQGLRFTFDVRHPFRGLEGGMMELHGIAEGSIVPPRALGVTSAELQQRMLKLEPVRPGALVPKSIEELPKRIQSAHSRANEMLKTSALLTDSYFLYTPAQTWLAALFAADKPLAHFYLDVVFGISSAEDQVKGTIQACAALLASSTIGKPSDEEMTELRRIDKKLYKCRNPEKVDIVKLNQAQKRDSGVEGEEAADEKAVKKRKLEREAAQKEGDDLFGPTITR